jgi:hypothetical protein
MKSWIGWKTTLTSGELKIRIRDYDGMYFIALTWYKKAAPTAAEVRPPHGLDYGTVASRRRWSLAERILQGPRMKKHPTKKRRISREIDRSPMTRVEKQIAEKIANYYKQKQHKPG